MNCLVIYYKYKDLFLDPQFCSVGSQWGGLKTSAPNSKGNSRQIPYQQYLHYGTSKKKQDAVMRHMVEKESEGERREAKQAQCLHYENWFLKFSFHPKPYYVDNTTKRKESLISELFVVIATVCMRGWGGVFLLDFIFWSSLRFTGILNRGYRDFPYISYPTLYTASPTKNFPYQSSTFVTTDEPTLTHQVSSSIFFWNIHQTLNPSYC